VLPRLPIQLEIELSRAHKRKHASVHAEVCQAMHGGRSISSTSRQLHVRSLRSKPWQTSQTRLHRRGDWDRLSWQQRAFRKCFVDVPEYCYPTPLHHTPLSHILSRVNLFHSFCAVSNVRDASAAQACIGLSSHGKTAPQSWSQPQSTGRLRRTINRTVKQKQLRGPSAYGPLW
jgi:hypothetical protein